MKLKRCFTILAAVMMMATHSMPLKLDAEPDSLIVRKFDFGGLGAADGYIGVSASDAYDSSKGYGFANTDEVFAVASGQPGKVGRYYLFGLIVAPYIGWSTGTLLGTIASGLLPASVMAALGIAIYGMFVAIVIPPARKSRAVALVLGGAVALACAVRYLPVLNRVSGGFVIIICAVIAASLGAIFAPIPEDSEEDAAT